MSSKHFCDACQVELTPANRASRAPELELKMGAHTFRAKVTWGSSVNATADQGFIWNDGDLCAPCLDLLVRNGTEPVE